MMFKRPFNGGGVDGTGFPPQEAKRFKNAVRDVLGMLTVHDIASKMEPFLRETIRDEVEKTIQRILQAQPSSRPSFNNASTSGRRGLILEFVNKLPPTIFTGAKIEAENGRAMEVRLLDAYTKSIITSGSQASMKFEILVLDGDFGSDDQDDWSENEFTANIIREREGRRPLVAGELTIVLKNGVGLIGDVSFTDNSSWQRSRKFRLGVRPVVKNSGIREARSEAFVVKDHRGELYKKHHPPSLDDEVWRLEKIAKDGAFHKRLSSHGIKSVGNFLQLYVRDPSSLREVLGGGISNRTWDAIINHAATCVLKDGKFYTFYEDGVGLLFDSIHRAVGAAFNNQNYEPLDSLTPPQKVLVESIKRQAYKNVTRLLLLDTNFVPRPLTSVQPEPINSQNLSIQQLGITCQDPPEMLLGFNNVCDGDSSRQLEVSLAQNIHPMQVFHPGLKNSFKFVDDFTLPYTGESGFCPPGFQWPGVTSGQLTTEDNSEVQESAWPLVNPTWGKGNSFFVTSSNEGDLGIFSMSRFGKSKAGWCKLRAALKLKSVRRNVAAKRYWQNLCV